jgi:hypothetical protein
MPEWLTVEVLLFAAVVLLTALIAICFRALALLNKISDRVFSGEVAHEGAHKHLATLEEISRTLRRIEKGWNQDWS